LHPGTTIIAWGKAKRHGDYIEMVNPKWQPADDKNAEPRRARCQPIYPGSETVSSLMIEQALEKVLDQALIQLPDHLHDDYRRKAALPTLAEAYRMVHRPANEDEYLAGRRRLAFDELLMLQLGVMLKRNHRRQTL